MTAQDTTGRGISIRGLSKVFGDDPNSVMPFVHDGISKDELMKAHDHVLALREIDLTVAPQRIQVVMGLSGCGKSTLIRHINRLIEPTEGTLHIDGEDILALDNSALRQLRRHRIAMVFQRFALLPHRTVSENVAYGLKVQGIGRAESESRTGKWISRVGLEGFEASYPHQLSGGMQQRVGLARALATDSEILLMDEAFSALDPLIRRDMQDLLLQLQEDLHKTIVFVTHDLEEAIRIGDDIAILRDGAIVQNGNAQDIVLRPVDDYIADFTRGINRGRVIKTGSIAEPGTASPSAPACDPDTTLEEALPQAIASPDGVIAVVPREGTALGVVTASRLAAVIRGD